MILRYPDPNGCINLLTTHRAPCKDCMSHEVMTQRIFLAQFDSILTWWLVKYMVLDAKPSYSDMKWLRCYHEEKPQWFLCEEFILQGWLMWCGVVETSSSLSGTQLSEAIGATGLTYMHKAIEWETFDTSSACLTLEHEAGSCKARSCQRACCTSAEQ